MRVVGVIFILSCLLVLKAPLAYADDGTVEIKKGDTCWDLSYKLAGDGLRFRELYYENAQALDEKARNMGLDSSDFCRKIFPGTLLRVPASMTGEILPRSFLPQVHMPSPLEEPKQGFVFPEMWWVGFVIGFALVFLHLFVRGLEIFILLWQVDGYVQR